MRIALVSLHTSPAAVPGSGDAGGLNVVVAEAARALASRGHEVVAVTRANVELAPGEYEFAADSGGSTSPPPQLVALAAGAPDLRKESLPAVVPEFAAGLRALATSRGGFDAVHAHYWLSGVAAREAFPHHLPAMTFHTLAAQKNAHLAPGDRPEPQVRLEAEARLAQHSFVVAGSGSELDAVTRHHGAPRMGSEIVHPGVNTSLFAPAPMKPSDSPVRLTVLGRVQPLKGQELAVRVAGELARTNPELWARCELVIAGEPTPGAEPYADHLRALSVELGIADRVRFLPSQTRGEAASLLASSALVLVPSHSETFGLTALEAAACGVPVIVGGHTGLVDAAPDGVAGVHMVDRDPLSWARTIAGLLADPLRREALGASARAHALSHDWGAHAAHLERIYSRLATH